MTSLLPASAVSCLRSRKNLAQKAGKSVIAKTYDAAIDTAAESASGSKRYRTIPLRNNAGRKIANVVTVPANTGDATSSAPFREASCLDSPRSRCRMIFSTTTIPAVPTASAKPRASSH